jgi:branched-chain amino acid transport system substrate-binding protein
MKKLLICLLGFALILGFQAAALGKTLKIGTLSPLTGPYAQDGTDILQGVKTAVALVKERGIPGFDKIEVLPGDSACDGGKATLAANKHINSGVAAVVGAYCSSATIPASVPINDAKVIQITPASTHEDVTERGFKYLFRACPRDDAQAAAMVRFLEDGLKIKTLALIDDKQTYTVGLTKNITHLVEKHGKIKIVAHEHIPPGDKDFTAVLTKLKKLDPDAIYMSVYQPEGSLMTRQAKSLGLRAHLLSEDAVFHPKYIEVAGQTAEGSFLTFAQAPDTPERRDFEATYKKMWGVDKIGSYAYYAFDAANIILGAVMATKSTDPATLERAIRSTGWKGATGTIKFDEKGDRTARYIIWVVNNGEFKPFWNPADGKYF